MLYVALPPGLIVWVPAGTLSEKSETTSGATTCVTFAEVTPPNVASPEYVAVMVWLPVASAVVVYVATFEVSVTVDSTVAPSLNATVPVSVPVVVDVRVAVNVTDCPGVDGFTDDVSAAVVTALLTTCVTAADVDVT
jgi:hypothetical protein